MNARRKSDRLYKWGTVALLAVILSYTVYDHRSMANAIAVSARSREELYQRLDADHVTHNAMEQRLKILTEEIALVEAQQKMQKQRQGWLEALARPVADRAHQK